MNYDEDVPETLDDEDRDMIANNDIYKAAADVWARLAAPLPADSIAWRQDGKPTTRDGKFFARFVCYVEAGTVRERLDSVVPGEWDLSVTPLPDLVNHEGTETEKAFKARLQILGVVREDVGQGSDYKAAVTDAFKRAAVRFGIGHELYAMGTNWVEIDGDGKFAKPLEDPQQAYERRHGRNGTNPTPARNQSVGSAPATTASAPQPTSSDTSRRPLALDEETCPKCGGRMWDNRLTKRNVKAPDYKCRDRSCDGVIWPAKEGEKKSEPAAVHVGPGLSDNFDDFPSALEDQPDNLPF